MKSLRRRLILFFLFVFLVPSFATAQTTATLGEKSIGTACANGANATNFDTIAQCNALSGNGTFQKAPLFVGQVTSPPYGSTACDSAKAGMIAWTGTSFQGCTGTQWVALSGSSGAVCDDDGYNCYIPSPSSAKNSQIMVGDDHTCAVKTDGTAWCWGYNQYGQLGNNTGANSSTPVRVVDGTGGGFFSGAAQVAGGYSHTCAVKTDGTVWCWGNNRFGQLGNNSTTTSYFPVQVVGNGGSGFLTGVSSIAQESAGNSYHACAVKTDGTAWCWGYNQYGQLGNNSTANSLFPVQVATAGAGVFTGGSQISLGISFSCAVKISGAVMCWGENTYGQLGNNSTSTRPYAVSVLIGSVNPLLNVAQISAGDSHACAVKTDGTVWCWGYNESGQLGNNSTTNSSFAVQVVGSGGSGFLTGVSQVSAGGNVSCALKTDGTVWCWGNNVNSRLGNNSTTNSSTPVQVYDANGVGYLTNVSQLSVGAAHTCFLKIDGSAWCWGVGNYGQLGDNSNAARINPVRVVNPTVFSF